MAVLKVLTFPNPILARQALPVTVFDAELRSLASDMLDTMYEEFGIGLAAPQVGHLRRIIVVDVPLESPANEGDDSAENEISEVEEEQIIRHPQVFINPEIIDQGGEIITEEGCLSVTDYTAEVKRAEWIELSYQTVEGVPDRVVLEGLEAVCVQHEIDHLEGILFIDRLPPLKRQMVKKKLSKIARSA